MSWSGRSATIYEATSRVARLVRLQLIWIGLSFAGGVVLGVFPAWFAVLVTTRHELRGEAVTRGEVWQVFRRYFWAANAFGYVTTTLIAGGVAQIMLLQAEAASSPVALLVPATTFWLGYWTVSAWAYLAAREALGLNDILGTVRPILLRPLRALLTLLVAVIALVILFRLPALAIALGVPGLALAIMVSCRPAS